MSALLTGPVTLVHRLASVVEPLRMGELFALAQPVEVELGSGDGSFMARYAAAHPERNFIAVERLLGRLRKLDRKGQRAGLRNLRLISLEAAYLVRYLLPTGSVSALHVYFPDPWPKRKHRKHRLINEEFTELAWNCLVPGGVVYLRTDDGDYFTQMTRVFGENPKFAAVETPVELAAVVTDFERSFNAKGIPTRHAAYQKQ